MWWLWSVLTASAGVWVREPGDAYVQVAVAHARTDRMFLADGRLVPQTDPALLGHLSPLFDQTGFASTELSAYAELGVRRGVELFGAVPVRASARRFSFASGYPDLVQRNLGFGDLAVGARVGTVRSGWAASGGLVGRAPLYDNAPDTLGVEAGNSDLADDRVPLGQGTYELEAFGAGGRGFGAGWALAEAGVRVRNRQYSAVLPGRVQLGLTPIRRLSTWVGLDAAWSLGNGRAPDLFRSRWGKGPLVVDNQRWLSATVGASVAVTERASVLVTASRTLAGARFPLLTAASAGVSLTGSVRRAAPPGSP